MRIKDEIAAKVRKSAAELLAALTEAANHNITVNINIDTFQTKGSLPTWRIDVEIYHREDL